MATTCPDLVNAASTRHRAMQQSRELADICKAWVLAVVCIALPTACLYWQRQFSMLQALTTAGCSGSCVCLLLLRLSSIRMPGVINALGMVSWGMRLSVYVWWVADPPMVFKHHFDNGLAYLLMPIMALLQCVLTGCMHPGLRQLLCVVYAALFAILALRFDPSLGRSWWRTLLLHAFTQLSATVPYSILVLVMKHAAAHPLLQLRANANSTAGTCGDTVSGIAHQKLPTGSCKSCITAQGQASDPHISAHGHIATDDAAATDGQHVTTPTSTTSRPMLRNVVHRFARKHSGKPTAPDSVVDLLKCMQTPYCSKLSSGHKVCLKLDTQLSCSDLPPDLAQQMQQALRRIGVPALQVSEVAVRPGCIMITLNVRCVPEEGEEQTAAADVPSDVLAKALLEEVQQLCEGQSKGGASSSGSVYGTQFDCKQAQVQIGEQLLYVAKDNDHTWQPHQVQALSSKHGSSAGKAWLGVASATIRMPADAVVTVDSTAGEGLVQVGVEVQVWGLGKLDEVEGWTPPAPGQHEGSTWQAIIQQAAATESDAADNSGSAEGRLAWPAGAAVGTIAGESSSCQRSFKLLVQKDGGYLTTRLIRVCRKPGSSCAIVQAVFLLPAHQLVRHHPGGTPSSLVLMSVELWEGEMFLSNTPVISLNQACSATAAHWPSSSPAVSLSQGGAASARQEVLSWWWGASNAVTTAAMAEVQALVSVLLPEASEPLPSFTLFLEDLRQWLLGVAALAQTSQYCRCGMHLHNQHMARASQLSPHALRLIGEGLQRHADSMGLAMVSAMLRDQMRAIVHSTASSSSSLLQLRAQKQGADSNNVSRHQAGGHQKPRTIAGRVHSVVGRTRFTRAWELIIGYPCHMCEAHYKQQLGRQLASIQPLSSLAIATYSSTVVWRVATRPDLRATMVLVLTWGLLHIAGAVHSIVYWRNKAKHNGVPASLYWSLAGYCVRAALQWGCTLGVIATPGFVDRKFRAQFAWAISHLIFVMVEQVQASAVLSASTIMLMALCMDLPSVLLRAVFAGGQWYQRMLVAISILLGARLVLDAHWRRQFSRQAQAHTSSVRRSGKSQKTE